MNDIVERLRQIPRFADFNAPPLIEHEAADEIERLRAENERLREALEDFLEYADVESTPLWVTSFARAALGEEKK
jgi:hypothetical protein